MENFQLISLFQQNATSTSNCTGYKYKLESNTNVEVDVPLAGFTNFIDSLLSWLYNSNLKYYKERDKANEANIFFDPTKFSTVVLEKIDKMMTPIIIDVSFEFNMTNDRKLYHDKFIYSCIMHLQGLILSIFKIPHTENDFNKTLTCFVLETDPYVVGDKIMTKIRFHFPYTKVNIEHINKILVRKFRDIIVEFNLIKELVIQTPTNSINSIISEISEYICLPGAKQTQNSGPFIMRNVYSYIEDDTGLENDYLDEKVLPFYIFYDLSKDQLLYFERNFQNPAFISDPNFNRYSQGYSIEPLENSLVKSNHISIEYLDKYQRFFNIPLILSVHFCNQILPLDAEISLTPEITPSQNNNIIDTPAIASNPRINQQQMLSILLPMISSSRFTEYFKYDWKAIGKAIHTIYKGSNVGLEIWKSYTKDHEMHYDADFLYEQFRNEMLDIRTIRHYASLDNEAQYNTWNRSIYFSKIEQSLSLQDIDFVDFAINLLCIKFVYDRKEGVWYYFDGNRLRKDNGCCILIDHLRPITETKGNDMIMNAIYDFQDEYINLSRNDKTRTGKAQYDGIKKSIDSLIRSMSNLRFLKKIVAALEVYMYDDFISRADENPDLMGCENCILECNDNEIITRPGKLQDYVTMSTNLYFPSGYTINTPKVQFMFSYYGKIFTNPEICHYFLKMKASMMRGGNREKFFWNFIGPTNGGKSGLQKFIQGSQGGYCSIVPNSEFTINLNANNGGPSPEIDRARNARSWIVNETDRTEKWHSGKVKKYTSNDDYLSRGLHKEGGLKAPLQQLCIFSNTDLDSPGACEAFYSRYLKIPCVSKFVDNPPESIEEQYRQKRFPIDLDFYSKISTYYQADLWIATYYYPFYMKEGIRSKPLIIKQACIKYQRDMDVIFNFISSRCLIFWVGDPKERVPDKSHKVSLYELHKTYVYWYSRAYGRDTQPLDQFKFRDEICDRISDIDDEGFFYGIQIKQDAKQIQNGVI